MEIKSIADVMKFHREYLKKVQTHTETIGKGKTPAAEVLIKEKEGLLALHKKNLDTAVKDRERVVRKYEERINNYQESITRLEKEIQEARKTPAQTGAKVAKKKEKKDVNDKEKVYGEK